ncbi:hypothetical protein [Phycicoccus avicenniae]|uniref:hypothetical protein n=1 Tax=Phycicoccus avicenniae TaxID=2828860 RepID=UPI003D2A6C60
MTTQRFDFAFSPPYRVAGLPFGVLPSTTWVEVGDGMLRARFSWWRLETSLHNVAHVEQSGGYAFVKTAGPPHLSFSDRGVTFATNGDRGTCVSFHEPVPAIDPTGRIRHPGATFTLADPEAFAAALQAA